MTNKFYYKIYGLKVQSEISLPGAYVCAPFSEPDITAELGEIPEFLKGSREAGYGTWTNGFTNAWFFTPDAAEFYIEGGKKIIIKPIEDPNWDLVSSLLLSAGMSLIFLQRNEPVIHGSALVWQDQAFIVSGDSGAGKSTVSFELMKKPYGFLADDTVHLHREDGVFLAEPSYPQQKLCRDQAERLGLDLKKLRYIDEQRDKFAKMCTDRYVTHGLPLKCIVILRKDPLAQKVYWKELTGRDYLDAMTGAFYLAETYRNTTGFPMELMAQIISLASQIKLYGVYRPETGDTVSQVTAAVEQLAASAIGENTETVTNLLEQL